MAFRGICAASTLMPLWDFLVPSHFFCKFCGYFISTAFAQDEARVELSLPY